MTFHPCTVQEVYCPIQLQNIVETFSLNPPKRHLQSKFGLIFLLQQEIAQPQQA